MREKEFKVVNIPHRIFHKTWFPILCTIHATLNDFSNPDIYCVALTYLCKSFLFLIVMETKMLNKFPKVNVSHNRVLIMQWLLLQCFWWKYSTLIMNYFKVAGHRCISPNILSNEQYDYNFISVTTVELIMVWTKEKLLSK